LPVIYHIDIRAALEALSADTATRIPDKESQQSNLLPAQKEAEGGWKQAESYKKALPPV
jgi:hypothetical protein